MIRFALTVLVSLWAAAASADKWQAEMAVRGQVAGSWSIAGEGNSLFANGSGAYFSADSFAEGVNAGRTDCRNARYMEIDYFFGQEEVWEGHVLFGVQLVNNRYQVIDPTVFFSPLDRNNNVIDTYANYDTAVVNITGVTCRSDGTLQMSINYSGELYSNYGDGRGIVNVSGASSAGLGMSDMSEY